MKSQATVASGNYPSKPISLIVPFSAGSSPDLVARLLEKTASKNLGQPLVIINRSGGTGSIAWNEVASASPDGYIIGITSAELLVQPLYGPTQYNYPTALDPLAQISTSPFVMAVQTNQPWQSVDDLVKYAKQHPKEIKFGHNGVGSLTHIAGETFAKAASITIDQVPFRGSTEAMSALLGGHIQVIFTNLGPIKEYVENGTIKLLAVTSKEQLINSVASNVPTFKEQGLDIVFNNWIGIAAPKELPLDVKDKLVKELQAMITAPEFKKNIQTIGLEYEYLDPKESQIKWITDYKEITKAVQEAGILEVIKSQKQ